MIRAATLRSSSAAEERVWTIGPADVPSIEARAKVKALYSGRIRGGGNLIGTVWCASKTTRDEPLQDPDSTYFGFAQNWVQAKIRAGKEPENIRLAQEPSEAAWQRWEFLNPGWWLHFGHTVLEPYGAKTVFEGRDGTPETGNPTCLAHPAGMNRRRTETSDSGDSAPKSVQRTFILVELVAL